MKPKQHALTGRKKSRSHRENLAKAGRAFWARAHHALAELEQRQPQPDAESDK
jgi:hypothetical protein